MFGSIMYTVEKTTDKDSEFKSIMMGCWWSVITVTTVGWVIIVITVRGVKSDVDVLKSVKHLPASCQHDLLGNVMHGSKCL